jgi:hypothetical protein
MQVPYKRTTFMKVKYALLKSMNYATVKPSAMLLSETNEAELSEFVWILFTAEYYSKYFLKVTQPYLGVPAKQY